MNFIDYFNTGEETPEEKVSGKMTELSEQANVPEIQNDQEQISEGLVDVIFQNLKTNTKVSVSGPIILFRWEWVMTKTVISIRVRKQTFKNFVNWLNTIVDYSEE